MMQRRVRVSTESPSYAVCVLGTEVSIDISGSIPSGATSFDARGTSGVRVYVVYNPNAVKKPAGTSKWTLNSQVEVIVSMDIPSSTVNDSKVRISYYGQKENAPIEGAWLYLTCVNVSLDADTDRSGMVKSNGTNKTQWTWGPDGQGAVLLVNCDRDSPGAKDMDSAYPYVQSYADLEDMSLMILRSQGPSAIFADYKLVLHVSVSDVDKVRVFHASGSGSLAQYEHVLGSHKRSYVVDRPSGEEEDTFYVEGLAFPDADFSGLVSFSVTLLEVSDKNAPDTPIFTDTVVFRVAPWIMTPNTLQPLEVFVCSMERDSNSNADFLEAMRALVRKANCKLTICPEVENQHDRWIQDEIEFGYVEAPHKTFPVVFDSPRDRGLKDFAFQRILGPDFGYVTRVPPRGHVSSLDSFGNLDVSPPVTVQGKTYPLGRILIGSSLPRSGGRRMTKAVRDFLYAQKVQPPVELYSDWLSVGHVDEFLSFVPAPDRKGFRLLLASPDACYKLFKEKQREGHGSAAQFAGLENVQTITIDEMLADETLRSDSEYVQSCIDWNRHTLKEELGLTEQDIIDIPQLFVLNSSRADAFFPDMVNMIVLGKHLGIPKPFGPIVDGRCCLEENVRSLLEPLGLVCIFINDFFTYHTLSGEIHCGTNVIRKPFSFKWWNMIP
ncbi:protein-arginine deiminase type-1-like [Malaclemys terrapin pileata]|uniref:protein-arginine deiminase type-1-like n=1 Tax=Malaclemys terrapin pileata TaxID=2991368 RepID=UPI0023A87076|nr:protein-arginine deiminase type-1-like [Malaclemys terrapin pileata]